jgi:hypothetical protein
MGVNGIEVKSLLSLLAGLRWTQKVIRCTKIKLQEEVIKRLDDSTTMLFRKGRMYGVGVRSYEITLAWDLIDTSKVQNLKVKADATRA